MSAYPEVYDLQFNYRRSADILLASAAKGEDYGEAGDYLRSEGWVREEGYSAYTGKSYYRRPGKAIFLIEDALKVQLASEGRA